MKAILCTKNSIFFSVFFFFCIFFSCKIYNGHTKCDYSFHPDAIHGFYGMYLFHVFFCVKFVWTWDILFFGWLLLKCQREIEVLHLHFTLLLFKCNYDHSLVTTYHFDNKRILCQLCNRLLDFAMTGNLWIKMDTFFHYINTIYLLFVPVKSNQISLKECNKHLSSDITKHNYKNIYYSLLLSVIDILYIMYIFPINSNAIRWEVIIILIFAKIDCMLYDIYIGCAVCTIQFQCKW